MTRPRPPALFAAGAAIAVVLIAGFFAIEAAAAAWLFLFLTALGVSVGALSLLLTGQLTGGVWFETLEPALLMLARAVPFIGLGSIPLMLLAPHLFPWAADGAHDPQVAHFYLNWTFVIVRAVIAVGGWTVLAWFVAGAPRNTMQVAAGLGLVFHVIVTTFLGYDWIMSLQPGFTSSVFGAYTAILFLVSALCVAAIMSPVAAGKASADISGLVMAGILGSVYIGFMQFLIIWYGDLAETAQFFLERSGLFALATIIVLLAGGALLPLAMLLPAAGRIAPARLRIAAGLVLCGLALYWGWMIPGLFGSAAVLTAFLAGIAAGAAFMIGSRLDRHHAVAGAAR